MVADYEGRPATKQTEVKLTYDDKNLYIFYKCIEPKAKFLIARVKEKDGPIWNDDCVELFISPSFGKTYHLIINSIGSLYDSEIEVNDQTIRGYVTNISYDSHARVKTYIDKDYWSVEISIPFRSLNSSPVSGTYWKINFAREDKVSGVNSSYSRLISSFYQPEKFSKIFFGDKSATLVRSFKIGFVNPLAIKRSSPLYKELLSDEPGNYTVYIWNHNMNKSMQSKEIQEKFTDEEWEEEVAKQLEELGQAGIMGPPLPWAKEESCMKYYKKYGMKRKCCTESIAMISCAVRNGAEVLNKKAVEEKKAKPYVSLIDPAYVDCVIKEIIRCANKYKNKPYISTIEGQDEPHIPYIQGKISEMGPKMKQWNNEVLNKYGFGKYSMPAPNDPSYWKHPETHPFQRIAFSRWASDKYAETKKLMYETLKKIAPNLKYVGCDFWFMSGFIPYDYSIFGRYSDMVSCDPYASSAERREGRGIYNHGFGTKLLKDLSGKPTITVVQAFHYAGYTPKPDDLREWVSQALKNGASRIEFYEYCSRYNHPEFYKEMLRISKIVTTMNKVKIPKDADTAIICCLDSEAAENANGDQIYTAYAILGEKIGCWFDFISDRQIERNEKDLSKYKIVYLPLGKYMEKSVVKKIEKYVKNGGILLIGDPEAFSYHIDGSSLSMYREKLTGAELKKETFKADKIVINDQVYPILKKNSIYEKIHLAHSVVLLSNKVKVITRFPNGKEAVLENKYGKGKVIYFCANPFAPDVVLIDSKIKELFETIQKNAGAKTGRPIWRFLLPKE